MLGRSDTALKCAEEALRVAGELAHPLSTNMALQWLAMLHLLRREPEIAAARIAAAEELAAEHGLSLWTNARVLRSVALVKGQPDAAVAQAREGLAIGQPGGSWRPYYHFVLAETLSAVGDTDGALAALADALSMAQASGERWWEAELCRQMGELRRSLKAHQESATWLQRALVVSRQQNAKALELRAAMSLARLWRDEGKCTKAAELLAPIYGGFTEGHDTLDLKEAKALLDQLNSAQVTLV
jgi:predicted ATPase